MRQLVAMTLLVAFAGCLQTNQDTGTVPDIATRDTLVAHAAELAAAISRRDAEGAARLVSTGDNVVYVSDGVPIRGRDYRTALGQFYAAMRTIGFSWDSSDVRLVDSNTGVFTGWARIAMTDTAGRQSIDRAVFTLVYARRNTAWEMVTAHKTTLR